MPMSVVFYGTFKSNKVKSKCALHNKQDKTTVQ